jgi:hypothetical protein
LSHIHLTVQFFGYFSFSIGRKQKLAKANLHSRKIISDPLCPICSREPENVFHILWTCPSSVAVWQDSSRCIQKLSLVESDSLGFIQQLLEKLEDNDFIEAVTLARLIWLRRNTLVFEGFFTPPNLVGQAKNQVAEFAQATDQSETCAGAVKPTPT